MSDDIKRILGEIQVKQSEIQTEQRRTTDRLDGMKVRLNEVHRGIHGSNGGAGLVGRADVQDLRLDVVEESVKEVRADRKRLLTVTLASFLAAFLAWARGWLPTGH